MLNQKLFSYNNFKNFFKNKQKILRNNIFLNKLEAQILKRVLMKIKD